MRTFSIRCSPSPPKITTSVSIGLFYQCYHINCHISHFHSFAYRLCWGPYILNICNYVTTTFVMSVLEIFEQPIVKYIHIVLILTCEVIREIWREFRTVVSFVMRQRQDEIEILTNTIASIILNYYFIYKRIAIFENSNHSITLHNISKLQSYVL